MYNKKKKKKQTHDWWGAGGQPGRDNLQRHTWKGCYHCRQKGRPPSSEVRNAGRPGLKTQLGHSLTYNAGESTTQTQFVQKVGITTSTS